MTDLRIQAGDGGVIFWVKIVPGSSRTAVSGLLDGMVKIRVSSPPERGKANRCLVDYLSRQLGLKKKDIEIMSGQRSPVKQIRVCGMDREGVLKKLGLKE